MELCTTLLAFKFAAGLFLLVVACAGGLLPLFLATRGASTGVVSACNAFAGGVLMAAALVHVLPDADQNLRSVSVDFEQLFRPSADSAFPLASMVAGIIFLFFALLEASVAQSQKVEQVNSTVWRKSLNPPLLDAESGSRPANKDACPEAVWRKTQGCAFDSGSMCSHDLLPPALSLPPSVSVNGGPERASAKALIAALVVHSILEGIGIGAQSSTASLVPIFIAVGLHKGLAGFALGANLLRACERHAVWTGVILFAVCSPVGIAIGAWAARDINCVGTGLVMAMASGTFLYVAIPELLLPAFRQAEQQRLVVVLSIVGFAAMSLLAVWA
mmetsp:Transcript_131598/g.281388  ORF Transcript_131598/g.281388 Transcript_131598/m.281388 type:complete len:331 (-) Transcript_131598:194-1186(-)